MPSWMFGGFLAVPPSLPNVFSFQLMRMFGFAPCSSSFFASSSAVTFAGRQRRPVAGVADAGRAVRTGLAQPRQRVQRRSARIGRIRDWRRDRATCDASSKYALTTAMFSALVPSGAASLTLAPWSSRTLAASAWSLRTANSSGVKPAFDFAFTSAPNAISTSAAAALPSDAAHISAVCPLYGSMAFTFAPGSSRTLIASTLPVSDAVISAVWPSSDVPFGSAPAFSRRSMIGALPLVQASDSGVIL